MSGCPIVPFRHAALLILLCLALYLPGLSAIPPLDRDEARFAQATKQMIETGDYIDIRFQETPRYKKPVGAYWLQAASVQLLSPDDPAAIWAYRVPSMIAAIVAVLLTHALAALFLTPGAAVLAAALLASSFLLTAEAHMAKTDALLLATVLAAQYGLARAYIGRGGAGAWLPFWLGIGVGALIKGPITPLIAGLTAMALVITDRRAGWLRDLRPLLGLPLAALIVLPWVVAVQLRSGGAFLESSVGGDLIPKLLGGMESHGSPPGYYLLLVMLTFWPGSLLIWPALASAWRTRSEPAIRFLFAWLLPAWVLYEIVPTKLPHYVLPLYPALAIMAAAWISRFTAAAARPFGAPPMLPRGTRVLALLWAAVGLALAVGAAVLVIAGLEPVAAVEESVNALSVVERFASQAYLALRIAPEAFLAAPLAALVAFAGAAALLRRRPRIAAICCVGGGVLFLAPLAQLTAPALTRAFVSPRIAAAAAAIDTGAARDILAVGYHEPSLVFLAGTKTQLTSPEAAAMQLAERPGAIVSVARRHRAEFTGHAARLGLATTVRQTIAGLNYSTGRDVIIDIITRADRP